MSLLEDRLELSSIAIEQSFIKIIKLIMKTKEDEWEGFE